MTNRLRCFLAATVLCLSLPAAGLAAPAGAEPIETLAVTAPAVLTVPARAAAQAEQPAVAAPAQAQAPVIYLVQPQAAAQPAAVAPAPSSSGGSVALGILGAIPGELWGALLGIVATVLFSFWRGSSADKARSIVLQLAEGAWYVAERNGGTGAAKFADACDSFYKNLTGSGLRLDAKAKAEAEAKPATAGELLAEAARS